MRSHRLPWLLAVLSLLSGCSLLVDFDPEGQPCDATNQCLPGYVCNTRKLCEASPDGGRGGSSLCDAPEGCPELAPETR